MILICPQCATRYRIAPGSIPAAGRRVRCRSCAHAWTAAPDGAPMLEAGAEAPAAAGAVEAEAGAGPEATPVPPAPLPPPVSAGARPSRVGSVAGWLLFVLLVLLLAAGWLGRNAIVDIVPGIAGAYEAIGLPVTVRSGLQLADLTSIRVEENGKPVLVVSGAIRNTASAERKLPRLRVALLDAQRAELAVGLFDAAEPVLEAGGETRFEARLADPPAAATTYSVRFADAS